MEKINKIMTKATTRMSTDIYPKFKVDNEVEEKKDFLKDLKICGDIVGRRLGKKFEFRIDEFNSYVIDQLWYYITASPFFAGDPQKGIFLTGSIGTGKTVLMLAFLEVMRHHTGLRYAVTFPETVHDDFQKKGLEYFRQRPLCIDDICREPDRVRGWWGENPIKLIIMLRNRHAAQSYATANFKVMENGRVKQDNEIFKKYGAMVFDRIRESYNFLELTGKSRR